MSHKLIVEGRGLSLLRTAELGLLQNSFITNNRPLNNTIRLLATYRSTSILKSGNLCAKTVTRCEQPFTDVAAPTLLHTTFDRSLSGCWTGIPDCTVRSAPACTAECLGMLSRTLSVTVRNRAYSSAALARTRQIKFPPATEAASCPKRSSVGTALDKLAATVIRSGIRQQYTPVSTDDVIGSRIAMRVIRKVVIRKEMRSWLGRQIPVARSGTASGTKGVTEMYQQQAALPDPRSRFSHLLSGSALLDDSSESGVLERCSNVNGTSPTKIV